MRLKQDVFIPVYFRLAFLSITLIALLIASINLSVVSFFGTPLLVASLGVGLYDSFNNSGTVLFIVGLVAASFFTIIPPVLSLVVYSLTRIAVKLIAKEASTTITLGDDNVDKDGKVPTGVL